MQIKKIQKYSPTRKLTKMITVIQVNLIKGRNKETILTIDSQILAKKPKILK